MAGGDDEGGDEGHGADERRSWLSDFFDAKAAPLRGGPPGFAGQFVMARQPRPVALLTGSTVTGSTVTGSTVTGSTGDGRMGKGWRGTGKSTRLRGGGTPLMNGPASHSADRAGSHESGAHPGRRDDPDPDRLAPLAPLKTQKYAGDLTVRDLDHLDKRSLAEAVLPSCVRAQAERICCGEVRVAPVG